VFGFGWSFNYGATLFQTLGAEIGAVRGDGKVLRFVPAAGNAYNGEADVPDTLVKTVDGSGNPTGWQLKRAADDAVEVYDTTGKLTSITTRNGQVTTLTYSTGATPSSIAPKPGLLIGITDPFGRVINFTYNRMARVASVTDFAGAPYLFKYDEASSVVLSGQAPGTNLTSITFPDTRIRVFHYNEQAYTSSANQPNALTGITDENGSRFSIYKYDTAVRVIEEQHAGGANLYSIVYNVNGTNTVTSPLSATRTYAFQLTQRLNKLSGITGDACPSCGPAAQTFDTNGYEASHTDWNGNLTTYVRADPNGRPDLETSRTEASGSPVARTITTAWHSTFRLPTLITEPGRTTAYTYDANGNQLTKTVTDTTTSESRTWTWTYSAIGQVLTLDGPRTDVSDVTTYTYYADNDADLGKRGNVATITNAASQVTTVTSYDANGRPLSVTDPNGLVTTLTWAPRGWLTSRTVGSETTTYAYDYAGQLTRVTLPDLTYLQYTYDAAHRLTQVADNMGNKVVYTLDAMGNRIQEEVQDFSTTLRQIRSRVFDNLNQLYQDIGGTSPLTQITTYGYDNQGNLTSITDPLSHVTTNAYDALNRLMQVTYPMSGVAQFGRNALDQLTSVTDPRNNATTYTVNALDDVTQQVSPDTGTTARTFDAAGNVLTATDAKGQDTTFAYDALNRVTQATYDDGSKVEYAYDAGTNQKGRLTSLTEKDPGGTVITTTSFTYDLHGRLLTDTRAIGGINYVTAYGYDAAGRRASVTYPSGRRLDYAFDAVGRVYSINTEPPGGGSAQSIIHGAFYHPFGGLRSLTFANGQGYARTYDLDGRIADFTLGGTTMNVAFDDASRITGQSYFPAPGNTVTYGYDDRDWLTSTVTPATTFGFTYDPNGNRTSKTVGANTENYAYPGTSNKLSSITGGSVANYVHDANGSITNDGTNTFIYDVRGRLIGAATGLGAVTYGLNALGQRYAKTVGGVTTIFHYDERGRLIAESNPAGTVWVEYFYLGDVPVALLK
jgi:YD repeat-containing protein